MPPEKNPQSSLLLEAVGGKTRPVAGRPGLSFGGSLTLFTEEAKEGSAYVSGEGLCKR